jgi:hypothetical protein
MRLIYDPRGLTGVMIRGDCDVTNGIRVDSHGFTGAYGSVEKDAVAYGSGT